MWRASSWPQLLAHKEVRKLLSDDHFSVDGTLIEAWASMKSFQPKEPAATPERSGDDPPAPPATPTPRTTAQTETKTEDQPMKERNDQEAGSADARQGRNEEVDFHGQKRTNATHASTTDADARLYRKGKGKEAKLCHMAHALMENRSGLVVATTVTRATGTAEREAALALIERHMAGTEHRLTLGADKGYDAASFTGALRAMNVTPHVAAKARGSSLDARTTRHAGYRVSQRIRKQIEERFGWGKTVGTAAKTMLRGTARVGFQFALNMIACNLVLRYSKLAEVLDTSQLVERSTCWQ